MFKYAMVGYQAIIIKLYRHSRFSLTLIIIIIIVIIIINNR